MENFLTKTSRKNSKNTIFIKLNISKIILTQNVMLIPMQKLFLISANIFLVISKNILKVIIFNLNNYYCKGLVRNKYYRKGLFRNKCYNKGQNRDFRGYSVKTG